jgi:hypothetical protein
MRQDPERRYWKYVLVGDDCWPWTGHVGRDGYGIFYDGERQLKAHRFSFALHVRPLEPGEQVDHTCHTRACKLGPDCPHRRCQRPDHLEAVSQSENTRRGNNCFRDQTHCKRGHEFTAANTRVSDAGSRVCIRCRRDYYRERMWREARAAGKPTRAERWATHERERTHCKEGHLLDEANTMRIDGERRCRICSRAAFRRWYAAKGQPADRRTLTAWFGTPRNC